MFNQFTLAIVQESLENVNKMRDIFEAIIPLNALQQRTFLATWEC